MISESTWEKAKHGFAGRDIDTVCVKGKSEPVKIFQLLCPKDREADIRESLDIWSRAMDLFRKREWYDALDLFAEFERIRPGDRPALLYQRRCSEYIAVPPPEDWVCVTMLDSK
jgi:adenylate cyclase